MPYYGKYRAKVTDVADPEERGRIRVNCPKVYGDSKSPWCEPCLTYANDSIGDFVLPKVGEFVWVEFEEGDCRFPIYTGGLWSKSKTPVSSYSQAPTTRQIEFAGCKILMKPGYMMITNGGATIVLNSGDIYLN